METPCDSMEVSSNLHGVPWRFYGNFMEIPSMELCEVSIEFRGSMKTPWSSMEAAWKLHEVLWRVHGISMELHGVWMEPAWNSVEFHGVSIKNLQGVS